MSIRDEWPLRPEDRLLRGLWIDLGSRMEKDGGWQRIDWLTAECLEEVARSGDGLATLYRDPLDGRYWEKTALRPELGDNSPPCLVLIEAAAAEARYGVRPA